MRLPTNPESLQRIQNLAALLQGWVHARNDSEANQDKQEHLQAEVWRTAEVGDAGLMPGWRVHFIRNIDESHYHVVAPWHRDPGVPWALPPGFRGSFEETLEFLGVHWLADYTQRLEALQAAAAEPR